MANRSFTSQETVFSVGRSFQTLRRFIHSIPLLRALFLPTVILSVGAVALPQFFLWLAGYFVQCGAASSCRVEVSALNLTVTASLWVLASIAIVSLLVRLLSWVLFEIGGMWALQTFHHKMVRGLQGVRTTFFDENPSGRLINRMVNDYESLLSVCVVRMGDTIQALLDVIAIAVMVLLAHPLGGLLIVPTVLLFLYVQWGVAPMLQRLSNVRSMRMGEVIHRETDIIEGARVFILYGAEGSLLARLRKAVRSYVQVHLLRVKIEAWGRLLSSFVTSLYSFIALMAVALAVSSGSLSAILGGAIVTILLRLGPACGWLAWSVGFLIESVGLVKRAFEMADLPRQEREEFSSAVELSADSGASMPLPARGDLEFVNYSMSYRPDSPLILNDLCFIIPTGAKVGVIGRTGSGKTSLIQSLFRMVYVQQGDILFAGVSLLSTELHSVRSIFGVVPQDPYLFAGSLRSNLDPDERISDQRLTNALTTVGLEIPLNTAIVEGGRNLSLGERQLLCLARVLVHDKPIILLDEPTSAVDNITDAKIQMALSTAFSDRTVIAIAHRIDTLRDYDLILEIQDGRLVRSGSPGEVL